MILLQAISVFFGLFMLYIVRMHRRKQHIAAFEAGVWIGIWVTFIFFAIFPQTVTGVTQRLNISRVFDLFVIIAFMILSYVTFMNRIAFRSLELKLEHIIRKNSINEAVSNSKN